MLNPLSEADSWAQQGNHNTERKTTSDLRRLSEWLRSNKGETRRPENIPPADLDELLGAYFLDVRKLHNGDEYEPDSLAAIQRSVDRHLRGHSYCCSIITDPRFKYSNECLLFKKKSLKAAGKGNRPNKAEPISAEEVRFLLDKKLLGPYSAESLINSLWYVNTVHLGIKGQKGHTTLLWGDVEKKADASGREYIEYHERTTKTLSGRAGIEPRPPEPPRAWGDPNNPLLCPVRLYDEYAKRRPPQSTYPTTRFYLSKYHGKRDDVWFIDIPMGKNTVGQIMKVMATKAYGAILNESGLNDLENRHLAKRAKQNANDNGEGSSISEDSSDESVILEDPPSNQMNNSLVSLYRKGNPDSGTSSPKGERSATGSPATVSTPLARTRAHHPSAGGTQVSTGGWFIDKRPEQSILIDLREEDAASPAIKREESDVSMLEPENTKKKGKLKRSKKRKGETGSVDEDIESSILNKKAKTKATELQYSTVKFEDVGGNDATLTELCKLLIHMRHPEVYSQLGVVPPRGFLLHGPPGCGKTLMAQAVAGELELPMLKVSAPELVSGVSGESEQKLRELFDQAVTNAPCILFIDEIDSITPKREMASKDMERRIVAQLLTCMDDLNSLAVTAQVLVIGATNRPDSLDPALRRAGRFDREICLGIPDEAARLRILKTLCRKLKLPEDFDYRQLARLTPGYVGADLMALCREAAMCAVNRVLLENQSQLQIQSPCSTDIQTNEPLCTAPVKQEMELVPPPPEPEQQGELARLLLLLKSTESVSEEQLAGLSILMTDFQASLACVQPSAKREGFATVPDVTWEDVGALQDIREELTMAILAPVRNPEQFKALGLNAPAGVLLAGPPGCGKTLLAKAVANESGLNFISVKGPELLNMYVGESERAVRQVFQRGRSSAPCVIFFDEIDALCPRRSGHESGAGVRVVNQLLTEMDGLECRRQVFIMAATNRPDIIDPAVLRPGRLDKTLYVGLPPPQDRHAILLTITKGGTKPPLELDVSLEEIAHDNRCDCFTGADLSALVREASVNALRAHLKSQSTPAHSGHVFSNGVVADIRVSKQNFEDAFKKVRPSVSKKDQQMYELLKESLAR